MKRVIIFSLCMLFITTSVVGAEKSSITNNCPEAVEICCSIIHPDAKGVLFWDVIQPGQTKKPEANLVIHEFIIGDVRKARLVPVFTGDEISISQSNPKDISVSFLK